MSQIGISKTLTLEDGRSITIETGKLAKQADGSVVIKMGNTMLLATVVSSPEAKEGVDFLPLSVDYQEKFAAVGRIPGSFLKREARLTDHEILICRIVDRAIRPLFPDDYHADTQIMLSLISADENIPSDALAGLAASAALTLSDIPFLGPISEVRVARINGELKINPYKDELEQADIDLIVAGTEQDINMVEGEMSEVSEADMVEALKFAHQHIKEQCRFQLELAELAGGRKPAREYQHEESDAELQEKIKSFCYDKIYKLAQAASPKHERSEATAAILDEFLATLPEEEEVNEFLLKKYFKEVQKKAVRDCVLDTKVRLDGRQLDEVRPIWSEIGYLPAAHGSAVFTRGETQSLTTVTLGTKQDEQLLDSPMHSGFSRFMLHYNFPAFSTGEVRPNRGPGRREIGHGNLALRGLKRVLPDELENPYTIRVVSDILESNGSSSMATVCAGSLALMDAGIKIKKGVSGIAMGMISDEESGKYAILSDILGDEDHLGDMDFKVVGTKDGIVACQMDIKVNGLSYEVLAEALEQSKRGRLHILNEMNTTIAEPAADYKPHAPRIEKIVIDSEFIGAVIGPGGKIIQQIQKDTDTIISITEEDNKGIVEIASSNGESLNKAMAIVKGIVAVPEVGEVYEGTVKSVTDFGAFIEFLPGKEGLLHISEISWKRLPSMEGVFQSGEEVKVKLIDVDRKTNKFRLSRKALLPKPEGYEERPPRNQNRDRNRDRNRDNGDRNRNHDRNDKNKQDGERSQQQ